MTGKYSVSDVSLLAYQADKTIRSCLTRKNTHNNTSDADSEDSDKQLDTIITRRILLSRRNLCRNNEDDKPVKLICPSSPSSSISSLDQSSMSLTDMWEEVMLVKELIV